jgi:kumamolisin
MKKFLNDYTTLKGSKKVAPKDAKAERLDPDQPMEVSVRLRRKESIEQYLLSGQQFSRAQYEEKFGASTDDISQIEQFANAYHLAIGSIDKARRTVLLKGKVSDFEDAFKVKLHCYQSNEGHTYRGRGGHIKIPAQLSEIVEGVFGLDDRPHSRPKFQVAQRKRKIVSHTASQSFTPKKVAEVYGFPNDSTGKGQCIAIIELGGGFRQNDLDEYFSELGLTQTPSIVAVSVDNGRNNPSNAKSADTEVMLDIEVAGAVAPDAKIVVYFAPNTDKGFLDAITTAIHDSNFNPTVISISWGSAEKNWTEQSLNNFNEAFKAASLLGVTICVATGDQGSSDNELDGKVHVDFAASSPWVLACGGTRLAVDANNNITSETVWRNSNSSATGGGISEFFDLPDYQSQTNIPVSLNSGFKGRGLPDVAGNADPDTGYDILVDGKKRQLAELVL